MNVGAAIEMDIACFKDVGQKSTKLFLNPNIKVSPWNIMITMPKIPKTQLNILKTLLQ